MTPKVSIITPSFNQGHFIEQTILSVLNQKYPNIEYIIIDGGSTDSTVDILKKYDSKITYWISEKDKGQSEAINKGLDKCTGEIIGWLNSDDLLEPNAIEKLVKCFSEIKEPSIVYGTFKSIDEKGKTIWEPKTTQQKLTKKYFKPIDLLKCWKNTLPQPSTYWNRSAMEINGKINENLFFAMDLDYWLRAINNDTSIYYTDEVLSSFRHHANAKSTSEISRLECDLTNLSQLYLNYFQHIFYRIEKYIHFRSTQKLSKAIEFLPQDKQKASTLFISGIISFPPIIFFKIKLVLVFIRNFVFTRYYVRH